MMMPEEKWPMADGSTIRVYLFGGLDRRTPRGDVTEEDAGVGSVAGLLEALKLPEEHVGHTLINGRFARFDAPLKAGDEVGFFPPTG
jgi:molybdopterin converting factor small subunit